MKTTKSEKTITWLLVFIVLVGVSVSITGTFKAYAATQKQANNSTLLMPSQWGGQDCDTNRNPGSKALATFQGVSSCIGSSQSKPDISENIGGPTLSEWECVELAMRYMFLVDHVTPYSAPGGKDVAPNFPGGHGLIKENNPSIGVVPQPGDIISFGPGASSYGHVAIVDNSQIDSNGNGTIQIFQQNFFINTKVAYPYLTLNVESWNITNTSPGFKSTELGTVSTWLHNTGTGGAASQVGHVVPQAGASHSPVIIENGNGQEEIFMVGLNAQLYHEWQNNDGSWSGWYSLGGSWPKDPAVDRDRNGVLEVFMVGNTGSNGAATLFHAWQTRAGSNSWTGWNPMAGIWPSETPTVTYNLSGEQEVFMRGLNAQIYHAWLSSNGWTSWYSLGGNAAKDPIAAQNANGLLGVFYIGVDKQLYYDWENNGGSWGNWTSLGGSWPNNPSINLNQNGVLEAFAIGNTGSDGAGLFHAWQNAPSSPSWTSWSMMSGNWPAGVPTVTQNTAGDLEIFMHGLNGYHLYHAWQTSPGSANWTSFYDFGESWSRYPVVFKRSNGLMDVFLVGLNSVLYHIPQNSDASWANPSSLGGNWP